MKKLVYLLIFISFSFESMASAIEVYFNNKKSVSYQDPYRKKVKQGENLEQVILDKIEGAQKSIYIAVQELRLPLVAKMLVKKLKDGVDVRLILENEYNNTIQRLSTSSEDEQNDHSVAKYKALFNFIDKNQNGITSKAEMLDRDAVYILNKGKVPTIDDTFDDTSGSGIMHHKFVVIDGKELITSTANFTLSGIHGDYTNRHSIGNANSLLVIKSQQLAKVFTEEFMIMWGNYRGHKKSRFGSTKPYRKAKRIKVGKTNITAQFSPVSELVDWSKSVNGLIGKEIRKSKRNIKMALFVFSDQKIANALKAKWNASNYDIQLLVEPKFAYRNYSELLDLWGLELLDDNCRTEYYNNPWRNPITGGGIPILKSGDMLHHKFAILDEETVIVGSQNWSFSANITNDENILVIKNKEIAQKYLVEFNRLYRASRLGPPQQLIDKIETINDYCSTFID